jgi:hypothetical protein
MKIGIYVYGIAAVAYGITDLVWGEFDPSDQPLQAWGDHIPGAKVFAYIAPFGWWSRAQPCCGAGAGAQARAAKPQVSERALVERHAYLAFFDTSKLLCPYLDHGSSHAYWCVLPPLVRKVGPPSLRFHTSRRRRARVL